MGEQWRPVPGYEGHYEVSDHGNVRSLHRLVATKGGWNQRHPGKILRPGRFTHSGHLLVALSKAGTTNGFSVHRLVLEAFVGPCPEGMVACHDDDDPTNNHLGNLRWGTYSSNALDAVRNGKHGMANKTHCKRGHEFTDGNTYQRPGAKNRQCRTCVALVRLETKKKVVTR